MKLSKTTQQHNGMKALCLAIALSLGVAQAAENSALYRQGQEQLDDRDWRAAQESFQQLVTEEDDRSDAALYWLAYAQFQGGRHQQAIRTLERLKSDYPDSDWVDDAQALMVEAKEKTGANIADLDDEMKLYAVDSLLHMDAEKTLPILKRIIEGNQSVQIKERALFVLSQKHSEEAFNLLASIARDNSQGSLQEEAITMLGLAGPDAHGLLMELYETLNSKAARAKVLESFFISGAREELATIARTETDPQMKREAIHALGISVAPEHVYEMYQSPEFADYKRDLLEALAFGGGEQQLMQILKSERDEVVMAEVIDVMSILGAEKTTGVLLDVYRQYDSYLIKEKVLSTLFIQNNGADLIDLFRSETNPDLKKQILQYLSMTNSEESSDFMLKLLEAED